MISTLRVSNFKLATLVEIEFEPGFTVLTGETGAGKSLIVDAIGLLLGGRARADTIGTNGDKASIEARLDLPADHPAHNWLSERELAADSECVLRRILTRQSASRAFINGNSVAVQELREIGELLVDIHGQHEHQGLVSRDTQRSMLDSFAKIEQQVDELKGLHATMRDARAHLDKLKNQGESDRDRAQLLEFQIRELRALELDPENDSKLDEKFDRLAHAQELMSGVSGLVDLFLDADDDSISERVGRAVQTVQGLLTHDRNLEPIAEQLDTLSIEISELASDLRQRLPDYEYDPAELAQIEQRLERLHGASRKYAVDINQLGSVLERFETELGELAADDDTIAALEVELANLIKTYDSRAAVISRKRKQAASKLAATVDAQLVDLGMDAAHFTVHLAPREERGANGVETAEFQIATNTGQSAGPLSRVASGGELSRVALAINMVCNQDTSALTQIYDEVDVGIGGRVAEMVGKKLHALAKSRQVLCVTHLAQVASQAAHHKVVQKSSLEDTLVTIETLEAGARTEEIARMLGGIEITERTIEHAGEMLSKARK